MGSTGATNLPVLPGPATPLHQVLIHQLPMTQHILQVHIYSLPYIKSAVFYLHGSTDEKTGKSSEMHLTYGAAFSSSHIPTKMEKPLI